MPLPWMSALKVIPWSDVIDAAPGIVKGARRMFARTQAEHPAPAPDAPPDSQTELQQRIVHLETRLAQLTGEQQTSAQLVETLAEHNARIVQTVDALRRRTRLLTGAVGVLALLLIAALAWSAR